MEKTQLLDLTIPLKVNISNKCKALFEGFLCVIVFLEGFDGVPIEKTNVAAEVTRDLLQGIGVHLAGEAHELFQVSLEDARRRLHLLVVRLQNRKFDAWFTWFGVLLSMKPRVNDSLGLLCNGALFNLYSFRFVTI